MDPVDQIIEELRTKMDNMPYLADAAVKLAAYNFRVNAEMAQSYLNEVRVATQYIDSAKMDGGKMTVSEAEKRAVLDTGNEFMALKLRSEAIVELINSVKKALDTLQWEYRHS